MFLTMTNPIKMLDLEAQWDFLADSLTDAQRGWYSCLLWERPWKLWNSARPNFPFVALPYLVVLQLSTLQ